MDNCNSFIEKFISKIKKEFGQHEGRHILACYEFDQEISAYGIYHNIEEFAENDDVIEKFSSIMDSICAGQCAPFKYFISTDTAKLNDLLRKKGLQLNLPANEELVEVNSSSYVLKVEKNVSKTRKRLAIAA